jgi:hypothetical protein
MIQMIEKIQQRIRDWRLARRYRKTGGRLPTKAERIAIQEWASTQTPRKLNS